LRTSPARIPEHALLLGVLKAVESELTRRDFMGLRQYGATPLWFLAETERNVYLWRNGKGLDDQRNYTFWIDVPALIEKRRAQLGRQRGGGFNPFINPLGGNLPLDERALEVERDYLDVLEDLCVTIFRQAEALSHASETVRRELTTEAERRTTVVLPNPAQQKGSGDG
jgi:hypothetical protein